MLQEHADGAALGEMASPGGPVTNAVLVYQKAEDDAVYPNLVGSWAVNLYGTGARYQVDHMLTFESLDLPAEAAHPRDGWPAGLSRRHSR